MDAKRPVIVDVGPDGSPSYSLSNEVSDKLETGALYVGVDVEKDRLDTVIREKRGYAVFGDLGHLPMANDSVDEIWLMNVFGGLRNIPYRKPDGTLVYSSGAGRYFEEMARVLKTGGRAHIGETYPPERGKGSTDWIMDSDYDSFGLTKEVYARGRINEFLEDHRMRIPPPRNDEFPFFVTLTKK